MSNRTRNASRAVDKAWSREQELVKHGQGTRDWTPEQQKSIIEYGKAYDDKVAFQGHHMKSVERFPEYQGDPDNIQFLTISEHLAAHGGNYQNGSNGYYDPNTKEIHDFGDGPFIPCEPFQLSEPICLPDGTPAVSSEPEDCAQADTSEESSQAPPEPAPEEAEPAIEEIPQESTSPAEESLNETAPVGTEHSAGAMSEAEKSSSKTKTSEKATTSSHKSTATPVPPKRGFINRIKEGVPRLVQQYVTPANIAKAVVAGITTVLGIYTYTKISEENSSESDASGSTNSLGSNNFSAPANEWLGSSFDQSTPADSLSLDSVADDEPLAERNYPEERSSPCEHQVSGYDCIRYGKRIHVDSYNRGGKHDD